VEILVDTSALYALLDGDDPNHGPAAKAVPELRTSAGLVTHNYVLVESCAVVQRKLGGTAVRDLLGELVSPVEILWVDEGLHEAGVTALLAATRRRVSLVDWVSFEFMRRRGIETAFAFDRDFAAQGFKTVP
jgi:predicted nucleic acid-binding protein